MSAKSLCNVFVLLLFSCTAMREMHAQQPDYPPPYTGAQASQDAYAFGEARRQRQIGQMILRQDQIRWYNGQPPTGAGRYVYQFPPSLSYAYATGRTGILSGDVPYNAWSRDDIFTPWPTVQGDIWGYWSNPAVPQPIGQQQMQTGPNRWESHPVYRGPREF